MQQHTNAQVKEEATSDEVTYNSNIESELPQNDEPSRKPEVEPEKLPDENPGIITEPKPHKKDDDDDSNDDDDDDDAFEPFSEPEIGDDPEEIKTKTPVM